MRYFLLFIGLFLLGCNSEEKQDDVIVFENVLGNEQTESLNLLVSDFESNLEKLYPKLTLQKSYEQYLKDLINPSVKDFKKFLFQSEETRSLYFSSGLRDEIYIQVIIFDENKQDSINGNEFNSTGKYMQALNKIKDSDSLINEYHHIKEIAGILQNELFVNSFLKAKPNFNNYFHKRIAVLEFSF